jgi:probable selenium-dependent hydroxylase accessory protein YqeC
LTLKSNYYSLVVDIRLAIMKLVEALDIENHKVISLVGGGGKTTLMFALARELVSYERQVITTTTTKIYKPSHLESPRILISEFDEKIIEAFLQNTIKLKHITIASEILTSGKLKGITPGLIDKLAKLDQVSHIIVEADGAAHRPLKAPNIHEPVIPCSTSLVVAVVGIDSLGCRLSEENVFRAEIASQLLGVGLGEIVTAASIARLITHPQGIVKGTPEHASIMCFINKVESEENLIQARHLATTILKTKHNQIVRVVLGRAQANDPVLEAFPSGD